MTEKRNKLGLCWHVSTPQDHADLVGHSAEIRAIVVAPDGRYALSAGGDFLVLVWNMATGQRVRELASWDPRSEKLRTITITPDSRYAILGFDYYGGSFSRFDLHTWEQSRFSYPLEPLILAVTPDSRFAVIGTYEGEIGVVDMHTDQVVQRLSGHANTVQAVTVSPNGRHLFTSGYDDIKIWDLESGRELQTIPTPYVVNSLAVTPDARYLLFSYAERPRYSMRGDKKYEPKYPQPNTSTIIIWNWQTGVQEGQITTDHTQEICKLAVTDDGQHVISSSADGTLKAWSWITHDLAYTCVGHGEGCVKFGLTRDTNCMISSSSEYPYSIKRWDLETGSLLNTFSYHREAGVPFVAISPDDQYVVSTYGCDESILGVWNMTTGERRHVLVGHTSNVNTIDFTRDSRYLLSAANDHTIRLWDIESGRCTRVLQRHSGAVHLIRVINDKQAVSASRDGTIVIWDLASGQPVGSAIHYRVPHPRKTAFATSPDGRYIAAVVAPDLVDGYQPSKDSVMLKVWDLTTRELQVVLQGEASDPCVRMSNHQVIFTVANSVLKVVDLHSRHSIQTLVCSENPRPILSHVVLAPDGEHLATTTINGQVVKVWDLQRQQEAKVFPGSGLAFALNNPHLISIVGSSSIKLLDIQAGVEVAALDLEHALSQLTTVDGLSSFALTHNGQQAVVGGRNGSLYCFNLTETTP